MATRRAVRCVEIPAGLPLANVEQIGRSDHAAYLDGRDAGRRWAEEQATFLELQRVEMESRLPFVITGAWFAGFQDGAVEIWHFVNGTRYELIG